MTETPKTLPALTPREAKDLKVLAQFTAVYCRHHHSGERLPLSLVGENLTQLRLGRHRLCPECREFLSYAIDRRIRCTLEPKPSCKHCHLHCYRPGHREKVREIMRFSGRHMILRGRLDLLWHYFF